MGLRRWLVLGLLLLAGVAGAQTVPVNGNLAVAGHINTCATNPSGGSDTYACSLDSSITALTTKACYAFVADVANSGAASINFSSLGAKTIKKPQGGVTTDLEDNDIRASMLVHVCYDGTNMQCQNCLGNAAQVRSLGISAGSMDVSGGCIANDPAALVTNGPRKPSITCTDADADSIEFDWITPDGWDAGTITVELEAFNTAAETTALVMHFAGQCVRSGDAVAAHSTTGEQAATVTWTNTANQIIHGTTSAITLQGTCAAGAHIFMRGQVHASGTTVASMATVKILGVKIEYTRSTGND